MATNPVFLQRFEKEYNAARNLDHPNVVRALDYGTDAGRPFLVMEFVEGESLGQRLERAGRIPEEEAINVIVQAAEGLERAHKKGLIHRDVKPDNIMVTPSGQAKLADLGLVKELETDINLTRTGRGLGTPHFMAPEQFKNAKNADVRCDVYSLGATLYMMVTGKMPFQALGPLEAWMKKVNNDLTPPRKLNPKLSERTERAIRRAMDPNPELRPTSCAEFIDDLKGQNKRKVPTGKTELTSKELWYLTYKDEEGQTHVVKGSMAAIRRSLVEGLLGDAANVRASRTKASDSFKPLNSYNEFRDLVMGVKTSSASDKTLPQADALAAGSKSKPTRPASSPRPSKESAPHIPLASGDATGLSRVKWMLFIAAAIGAGVVVAMVGHFLFHK
jgi:serine/threonine protein kinase